MVCSIQVGDNLNTSFGKLKVAVLCGGIGEEREISIRSGRCVADAIQKANLNVITVDIQPNELSILDDSSIDIFFLALHGEFGEDGQLQQILEDKSLCYTGSGPKACELAFDKLASKRCFANAGIATPKATPFDVQTEARELEKQLLQLSERFVVKPLRQGSTIGVSIADDPKSAIVAARKCSSEFGDCMIEQFIPGRDITVGILLGQALPIIELRTQGGFYDYHAKYVDKQTKFLFDTIEDSFLREKVKIAAIDCFNALGCRHFARVDFRLGNDGIIYALELNAIPGFTTRSDLPKAAEKAGLSMSDLCIRIIEAALEKKNATVNR
jgi:D-alanine-D-alanine ligase